MLSNFIKKVLAFGSPVVILAISYFVFDPFHVLKNYKSYGSNHLKTFNRNTISTTTYLNNKDQYGFDSFILGSSRSSAFRTYDYNKAVKTDASFHFDSFNDNISGMALKLAFLEKNKAKINNVLLVFDTDTFSETFDKSESIVHHKDYRWSGENVLLYHLRFFKAFFTKQYFIHYFDLKINKTYRTYMDEFFKFKYFYKAPFNDFYFPENVEKIKADSVNYYSDPAFHDRPEKPKMHDQMIEKHHLNSLKEVSELLKRNKTQFKVVLSPLFDQRAIHPADIEILEIYFGKEKIYNFSGKNKYTNYPGNYYELSHYKPSVGKGILEEIY